MADEDLERITILLQARDKDFQRAMDRNNRLIARFGREAEKSTASATRAIDGRLKMLASSAAGMAGSLAAGFAGGLVMGAVDMLTTGLRDTVRGVAEVGDAARRAGLGTEAFQEWAYVAQQNRIGIDSLVDGFKELSLRADEYVVTGAGSAAEAFQRLGFSALELKDRLKDPSALMLEVMRRLQRLDKAAQIRIADEVFGGTGGERFVELLAQGEAGLRRTMAEAHEVGAVMDEAMIAKAAELDQRFGALVTRVATFGKTLAVTLADLPFDVIETRIDELFRNEGQGRSILGDAFYDEMRQAGAMTEEQVARVEALRNAYAGLQEDADGLAIELASAAGMADQLGNDALWQVLAQGSQDLRALSDQFSEGAISGEEFAAKLGEIRDGASTALGELQAVDAQGFTGVIASLGMLGRVLDGLAERAKTLRKALPADGPPGMDTGKGLTQDDIDLPGSGVAPSQSPRPRSPGVDSYGDWKADRAGGKGKGGSADSKRQPYEEALKGIVAETAALKAEADALAAVTGARAAAADAVDYARARAELLVAAQQQGIEITPEVTARIDALAAAYVQAGGAAERAADRLDAIHDASQRGADAVGGLFQSIVGGAGDAEGAVLRLLAQIAQVQMMNGLMRFGKLEGGGGLLGGLGRLLAPESFDGGGYTGAGPRVGGLDGRGGRLAMIHPDETVIDHTRTPALPRPAAPTVAMPAARGAARELRLVVAAEEGAMFRPVVRAESRAQAVQVAAPMVSDSARGTARAFGQMQRHFQERGTTT